MRHAPRSAVEYAEGVTSREGLRWAHLESAAFTGHPDVQAALAREDIAPSVVRRNLVIAWVVSFVVLPPVVSFFALLGTEKGNGGMDVSARDAVPLAAVLVTIAAISLLLWCVVACVRNVRDRASTVMVVSIVAVPGAILLTSAAAIRGSGNDVEAWGAWVGLMLGALALVVLSLVLSSRASAGAKGRTAAVLAGRLEQVEKQRISEDVTRALRLLATRGVVTDHEATRRNRVGRLAEQARASNRNNADAARRRRARR